MTAGDEHDLEQWLSSALHRKAEQAPNRPHLPEVERRAAGRRRHRRLAGARAILATVATVVIALAVPATSRRPPALAVGSAPPTAVPTLSDAMHGSLVLPLTGTVEAGVLPLSGSAGLRRLAGGGVGYGGAESTPAHLAPASDAHLLGPDAGAAAGDQSIDVPPGTGETLDRLSSHVSPDGVIVWTFLVPNGAPARRPRDDGPAVSVPPSLPRARRSPAERTIAVSSCSPTAEVLIEASDTRAVGTFTEPFYAGFTTPLVAVEIGELGVPEASPATWVEAQVGPEAARVEVRFADGVTDQVVPASGVAVLASQGDAGTAIGTTGSASLQVLDEQGHVLASYALAVATPASKPAPPAPSILPAPGRYQPADPATAAADIGEALATALSCTEPPVVQAGEVAGGGPYEEVGGAGSVGISAGTSVVVQKVVFTDPASAVVRFVLASAAGRSTSSALAEATLVDGTWLVSLGSVSPGLEVTGPEGDGDVQVAPGGPILVEQGSDGTALAVYRAVQGGTGGCILTCAAAPPDRACVPTGGIVEEVTTPGAVGILASPLFADYRTPFIGVGLAIVGEDEGAPATVVSTEVAAEVASVEVADDAGHQVLRPVEGTADAVLAGAPATALSARDSALGALGAGGTVLASVPITVDAGEPAPASSLPTSLPAPGAGPPDPAAATTAIEQAFTTVFGCAGSPFVRAEDIQDNGMFTNPVEQLYVGGYASLVESVYATVDALVFVSPTLADVSYTLAFHDDPTLSFREIGTAVLDDGSWRVSYATLCAAVALGGVRCDG